MLHSVTGILRVSGYCVFQAYDGGAAQQLCEYMPDIDLLVLNTEGTGMDTTALVNTVRQAHPGLPVLHIGKAPLPGMPDNVLSLPETLNVDQLLAAVRTLVPAGVA